MQQESARGHMCALPWSTLVYRHFPQLPTPVCSYGGCRAGNTERPFDILLVVFVPGVKPILSGVGGGVHPPLFRKPPAAEPKLCISKAFRLLRCVGSKAALPSGWFRFQTWFSPKYSPGAPLVPACNKTISVRHRKMCERAPDGK